MESTMRSADRRIIFVLGPPGSGKGTACKQAVQLLKRPEHHHVSVGDLARQLCHPEARSISEDIDPVKISECLRQNKLLPASLLVPIIKSAIYHPDNNPEDTWLIDGFPRNMEQLLAFEEMIGAPTKVIVLDCSRETAQSRYLSRARELMDDEARFETRFNDYVDNMEGIEPHYKTMGNFELISADGDKEKVLGQFMLALPGVSAD
ncbi:P-loop containing nucleoside triphosphate hydrolase protein [Xylaria arbuscula]|nr:P-loop containing nucleoside triphosphate hydrolase protein [Xylaria arbuscula]